MLTQKEELCCNKSMKSTFQGEMIQFKKDTTDRMDRIENKLDRFIEKNIFISAIISGGVSVVVAIISFLERK